MVEAIAFVPVEDVRVVLGALLDRCERRPSPPAPLPTLGEGGVCSPPPESGDGPGVRAARAIKLPLSSLPLPAYFSQEDPEPRLIANQQFQALERLGLLRLAWLPGEQGHLLEAVRLEPQNAASLYALLGRTPEASRRARLESRLMGERFRFPEGDWRAAALRFILQQLSGGKSPAPFSLLDDEFNQDLLAALTALGNLQEETPYRVFSVRTFNDSKRFDDLAQAVVRLACLGHPDWRRLPPGEVLGELNLVANPTYLHLSGLWELTTEDGQVLALDGFRPALGFPAAQASHVQTIRLGAPALLCVENPTSFYRLCEAARTPQSPALFCLMGNPSPAARRLLRLVPDETPLLAWADLDYGGFNILSQLRRLVRPDTAPYCMDIETFEAHAAFARPLTTADRRNLARLSRRPELRDVGPVVEHLLQRGLKLEQEAIV